MEPKKRGRPLKADAKTATLRLRIDKQLDARLRAEAQRQGVAVSELVRRAILDALPSD